MATEKTKKSTSPSSSPSSPKKRKADIEQLEVDVSAPEPPSKRARRALKKGKTLPPKQDSDDEKEAAKADKEQSKAASARSEHSVWIGNLPFTAAADDLRNWLVEKSGEAIPADSITRIHLPTQFLPGKREKGNKGFAYVDFAEQGPKVAALALSESWLGIRKLLIKDAKSFEGRPKKEEDGAPGATGAGAGAGVDVPTSRKIFVGNLSFQTTEDDVRANFDRCGEIEWVKIATFEDSGKCKGYGWVTFKEPEAAAWAVKGFVKIKEGIETEDDFVESKKTVKKEGGDGNGDGSGEDEEEDEKKERKFKTRKWWVNRIAGRNLKIELAEDDQTRYKKRFGKDALRKREQGGNDNSAAGVETGTKPKPARDLKAQDDLMVARLMGTAAKHTGTKITFD